MAGIETQYVFLLVSVFVGACLAVACINRFIVKPMRWRRHLNQRLKGSQREQEVRAQIFKAYQETRSGMILSLVQSVAGWSKIDNLQLHLLQADIFMSPGSFLCLAGILGSLGFFTGTLLHSFLYGIGFCFFLAIWPFLYLRWKKRRKTGKIEQQMPDAMELLARSLRAGHTLQSTLELISQEIPAPLGAEMRITYEEQRLGLSMAQALRRMGDRVSSRDLRYFVTAVLIQIETGGNLAEILENIGAIIRDRLKLKSKVKGLTAEGRFSAIILGLLPVVTFLALFFINRPYVMTLLTDPAGTKIFMAAIGSITVGALVMKKMVAIKV
jgi:tight adherence protein B